MTQSRAASKADFEREVMPHLAALYGVALRMTRSQGDAEDLVQETVLRAYRFWGGFASGTNCKAWLFRILTNAFNNRYRELLREREIMTEAESSDANLGQFVSGGPRDAETALFGHMVSRDVERALADVPAEFRLAVMLADLEDFSYKEIAEIMDCPAGTVMSRLYRGRKILQGLLYDHAVEQGIIKKGHAPDAPDAAGAAGKPVDLNEYRRKKNDGGGTA